MAIHSLAEASLAILCNQARLIILRDQIVQVMIGFEDPLAATAAITTAGSTFGTILLSLKGDAPFTPVSCAGVDLYFINEHVAIPTGYFRNAPAMSQFRFLVRCLPIPKRKRARREP